MKKSLENMWLNAMAMNKQNILALLQPKPDAALLDLGCDDGLWTVKLGEKIKTKNLFGVDIVEERVRLACQNGVNTTRADLNQPLRFSGESFDVIHANQVIEHVSNLDLFLSEVHRLLKPGGYVVMSTENGSSWCNIFSAIMGWQIFSLTNISALQLGLGNPLALHQNSVLELSSWTHKTIFNYRGLIDFFSIHGFLVTEIVGAGYFPLPAVIGRIDPRHSHFLTISASKIMHPHQANYPIL
jgi:SAM-dependent methyltransferase